MELQHHQQTTPSTSLLPYEPIKFVFTQTIGSLLDKFKEIIDPYTWTYQDILQPRVLNNLSKIEYYLFHVAPIYNWLRQIDSQVLRKYLDNQTIKNIHQNNKHPHQNHSTGNTVKQTYKNFDKRVLLSQLKHYISQWEIVKLSASAKIKIITTKVNHQNTNNNNSNNNNIKPQTTFSQNEQKLLCTHMIKKQKFTTQYTINNFSQTTTKLQCLKHYCEQCQRQVPVKTEMTKYPFAPLFNKFYGKDLTIDVGTSGKQINYQLLIVYGAESVFLKSSGGVWYEVGKGGRKVVSFQKVDLKKGQIFVYQQKIDSKKVLKKAEPMAKTELKQKGAGKFGKQNDSQSQEELFNLPKPYVPSLHPKKPTPPVVSQTQPTINQPQVQSLLPQDQPLQQLCKAPLPIIMSKKRSDKKLFKQYKKTVQQLLPKPKEKDEYEKDYDKGKTKKIHKNRQVFRTADFFDLYNKRKIIDKEAAQADKAQGQNRQGEIHQEGQKGEENKGWVKERGDKSEKRSDRMQAEGEDDDDKLDMYEGKRDDRNRNRGFSRGRGRGGRGGNFSRRDGHSSKQSNGKFSKDGNDRKFDKNRKSNNGGKFNGKFKKRENK